MPALLPILVVLLVSPLPASTSVSTADELRTAIASAIPGTEIVLAPGVYAGQFDVRASGEPGRLITIRSAETWRAEIAADGDGIRLASGVQHVAIEGLRVSGARLVGIRFQGCRSISILDCRVELCRAQGIVGDGEGHVVRGNLVQRNGLTRWDHGVYLSGSGHMVANNVVRGNAGWGLHLYPEWRDSYAIGNHAYGNGHAGIGVYGSGNTLMGNHAWGNGRWQYQIVGDGNRQMGNVETDPRRWPLKARPEPTGGIWVPTGGTVQVWESSQ